MQSVQVKLWPFRWCVFVSTSVSANVFLDDADYGKSYYDVIKTVMNVIETFKSDRISDPSNFKYLIALEKQVSFKEFTWIAFLTKLCCKTILQAQ